MSGHLRVALDTKAELPDPATTAKRHRYVILQPWDLERKKAIKAARSTTRCFCHKNLAGASAGPATRGLYSTGLAFAQAQPWLLRDSRGTMITFKGYDQLYACDVGDPNYQRAWGDAVTDELVENGWDGALLDNADTTMEWDFVNYPVKYPNDDAWRKAMGNALLSVGALFKARGKLCVPNIGAWGGNPDVGREWLRYVDGAMHEMFVKWGAVAGSGYAATSRALSDMETLRYADSLGKFVLAVTHSSAGDHQAALYGWCCALMGNRSYYCFAPDLPCYTKEAWIPEFDFQLGKPLNRAVVNSNGTVTRRYRRANVIVNPTSATYQAIPPQSGAIITP